MTVTITPSTTYPIPDRELQVSVAASTGNYVRIYCTAAPLASEYRAKLDALEAGTVARVQVHEGDASEVWRWTPDAGGVFTFSAEEITKGASTHGGGYLDDPAGYQTETIVGTSTGLTVTVGSLLTAAIGVGGDTARLELYVFGAYVRATTLAVHGVLTPAISDPTTPRAKTAAENSTVVSAVSALADVTVASMLGSPSTVIDNLITKYELHRASATYHDAADSNNPVASSFRSPGSPAGIAKSISELRMRLTRHMQNDDGLSGMGTSVYHKVGGNSRGDQKNAILQLTANEQDPLSQCLALADLWRAYEAHRVDTDFHIGGGDTVNAATTLPALLSLYRYFLSAIQVSSPTVPATENSGAVYAVHSGGFAEG